MTLATLGISSIGDMGLGIGKLLKAHGYRVITNATGRSEATRQRARESSIEFVANDLEFCNVADAILSIVPPATAISVASGILAAACSPGFKARTHPLYFLELNAISPARARHIDDLFTQASANVRVIDGGIIGSPPSRKEDGTWAVPSIPMSGQHKLCEAFPDEANIAHVLNVRHISETIGSASGLKMCFASLSKGFTALAIQSFTTASNLGVLSELQSELDMFSPGVRERAEKGLVSMPPKAYRWVDEMREIGATFELDGGFSVQESPFRSIAEIYDLVAHGTALGAEVVGHRRRGQTAEDVAVLIAEGTQKRKEKID